MIPRPFTRGLAGCFATLLACALIPGAAEAASVSESPTTLTYTADAGETNNLSIVPANGAYVVKDTGAASLVDGDGVGGCTVTGNTASCPIAKLTEIDVALGDRNDVASVRTPITEHIAGGLGDDRLTGGAAADVLNGDEGVDTLDGGPRADTLNGGPGARDTVSYASRGTTVGVTIDGTPNDGNADDDGPGGVRDNVMTDVENVIGGKGNDDLGGSAAANVLQGGPGNDDLAGGDGNDVLDDGVGTNWFEGGPGDDLLRQGPTANAGDTLHGGVGTDTVSYQRRSTRVFVRVDDPGHDGDPYSNENDDVGTDVENLVGGAGDDWLQGGAGTNRIDGGPGGDAISGGNGADQLIGGPGNDQFDGGAAEGADDIRGGPDTDNVSYAGRTAGVNVSLDDRANDGDRAGEGDNVRSDVENLTLGQGDDIASGDDDANNIDGEAGANTIHGNGGDDSVIGGSGNDALYGDAGNDLIRGQGGLDWIDDGDGNDDVDGGDGRDTLYADAGPNGADILAGGPDYDRLGYDNRATDVNVTLDGIANDGDVATSESDNVHGDIETVSGGQGSDILVGDDGAQVFFGGYGNAHDLLVGNGGPDTLEGGGGNDALYGGPGDDYVYGDTSGTLHSATEGDDTVYGQEGDDHVGGEGGNDYVDGGDGNDFVYGDAGGDTLQGGTGVDNLYGGNEDDLIRAKDGASDVVDGGNGNDTAELDRSCVLFLCWDGDSVSSVEVKQYP